MVEWQTEMATYVLFTVHTDNDDTLIFYIMPNNLPNSNLAHYLEPRRPGTDLYAFGRGAAKSTTQGGIFDLLLYVTFDCAGSRAS